MIKLFASNIDGIDENELGFFLNFVSEQKRKQIQRYKMIKDAKRSLLGELLIRKVVIDTYHCSNDSITFSFNQYGKPFISNIPNFHFNLSHSGNWVVCAVSTKAIGVDIEEIKEVNYEVAEYCFSKKENSELLNVEEDKRPGYFFMIWTLKESYLKAQGIGIIEDLKSINFEEENNNFITRQKEELFYKLYEIDSRYSLAVCGYEKEFDQEIKQVIIKLNDYH